MRCIVQVPAAHGRYIVCYSGTCSAKLVGEVLSKRFPQYRFNCTQDAWPIPDFDTSKVCALSSYRRAPSCSSQELAWLSSMKII